MFNRYFEAGEDSLEFLFAHLTIKNIDFALISLTCIMNPPNIDYALYQDKHTYYFSHIQSVLTACGNLYNVFYGNGLWTHRQTNTLNRPALLRDTFNINRRQFPLVFEKAARNTNEHFDERFDDFRWNVGDYNILDHNTPLDMWATILNSHHLRTFNCETGCYHTYVRRSGRLVPMTLDFRRLQEQLLQMKDQIVSHPIFESRWSNRMPGDILEG